jgi:hypothetical protein
LILAAIALLVSLATGWCLCALVWPAEAPPRARAARSCLAAALGLWAGSVGTFLALVAGRGGRATLVGVDLGMLALASVLAWLARARGAEVTGASARAAETDREAWTGRLLQVALLGAGVLTLLGVRRAQLEIPYGHWDAWAIWNLKAKFLHAGTEAWRGVFSEVVAHAHPDYPLLLPLTVARLWSWAGHESPRLAELLSVLLALLALVTLVSLVGAVRGRAAGAFAGLLLLAVPRFAEHAGYQLADLPLSANLVGALGVLAWLPSGAPGSPRLYVLAGLLAGAGAWTKSEGGLMAAALLASLAVRLLRLPPAARAWRPLLGFVLGCALASAPALFLRVVLTGHSTHFGDLTLTSAAGNLLAGGRHWTVLAFLLSDLRELFGLPLILGLAALALASGSSPALRSFTATAGLVLAVVLLGEHVLFVITSKDLSVLLGNTTPRLSLQLLPSFLLVYTTWLRMPVDSPAPFRS